VDMMCADFISVYVPETCGISICIWNCWPQKIKD
jgi:hypothetical protein